MPWLYQYPPFHFHMSKKIGKITHLVVKMEFHYSHLLVEKKNTKLIYHMPWLYQYPPLPFHRSQKN